MGNAVAVSDLFSKIKSFLIIINKQLFGNCGDILVWGMLIVGITIVDKY